MSDVKYIQISGISDADRIHWVVHREHQGQIVKVAYGDYTTGADVGSRYMRRRDTSDGTITYYMRGHFRVTVREDSHLSPVLADGVMHDDEIVGMESALPPGVYAALIPQIADRQRAGYYAACVNGVMYRADVSMEAE